jgi:tRNA(Ile)-lysidine synthase
MNDPDRRVVRGIERRVLRFAAEHARLPAGSRLLLAVSGGADSLALLHIIARNRDRLNVELVAGYVDHQIRPAGEVEAERSFVAEQSRGLGVGFLSAVAQPAAAGGRRRSPEDAARRARYAALASLARAAGVGRVATGHTASDQAETVVLRLLRGSGLRGLAAMRPSAPWPLRLDGAPTLLRPLLSLSRDETAAYCRALGLEPRLDPENANHRYLRNRVRRELLPALRALNPRIDQVLTSLADEAAAWVEHVDGECPAGLPCLVCGQRELVIPLSHLTGLDPVRRTAAVRTLLRSVLPDHPSPSRAHIEAVVGLTAGAGEAAVALPGGREARRVDGTLRLGRPRPSVPMPAVDVPVPVPGEVALPGWRVRVRLLPADAPVVDQGPWTAVFDAAAVRGLTVGRRRAGERIALAGMSGQKRVQDLFVDAKVPRGERDRRPVFRGEGGVVWVAGLRAARWAARGAGPAIEVVVEPEPAKDEDGDKHERGNGRDAPAL